MSVRGAAALLGLLFLALGITGIVTFGFADVGAPEAGQELLSFGVSPILNVVHTLIGAALFVVSIIGAVAARRTLAVVAGGLVVLALAGFVLVGNERLNVLGLNPVDVLAYLVVAFLAFLLLGATKHSLPN